MKSIFKIAVEAMITVSLIALLSLVAALVYGLLSLLSPAPIQAATPAKMAAITAYALPESISALSADMDAPQLVDHPLNYDAMTTRELRRLARDKKIPYCNKLTKKNLILALNAIQQAI